MPKSRQQSGVVLVLSMLLLASITASTITVSTIIAATVQQSRNLDDFIIASSAADAGLERAFAVVKKGRQQYSLTDSAVAAGSPTVTFGGNRANFQASGDSSTDPFEIASLRRNESVTFDILKVDTTSPPHWLQINGTRGSNEVLEVSWIAIDNTGETAYANKKFLSTNLTGTNPLAFSMLDVSTATRNVEQPLNVTNLLGFRVTLKVIEGTHVTSLNVRPYNGNPASGGSVVRIPSRISVTSTGQAGEAQSQKSASLLWQLPASQIFNFVLFTEGNISPNP